MCILYVLPMANTSLWKKYFHIYFEYFLYVKVTFLMLLIIFYLLFYS
jgi:hypothetical protein